MSSMLELDLVGIGWPVCLLKFKCALNGICSDDVMVVLARDPDVVKHIIMILERSGATLINRQKKGDIYQLSIKKSA